MSSVNLVVLVGRLGKDVETKHNQGGSVIANFSMATEEKWTKDGEKQSKTTWHNIVAFGKLAEICEKWLSKGSLIYIEGRIQHDQWEDDNGNKRYATKIVANKMQMLGGGNGGNGNNDKKKPEAEPSHTSGADLSEEDIPFIYKI